MAPEDTGDNLIRANLDDQLVCRVYKWRHAMIKNGANPPWPEALLMMWTGQSEEACEAAMERAEDHGLIEYGVSLRSGWLTEAGQALADEPVTFCFHVPIDIADVAASVASPA